MQPTERHDLPELDDWLEHIDTVVLGREDAADVDPPVEDRPRERNEPLA